MKRNYRHMTRQIAEQIRDLYFSRWFKQHEIAELYGIRQHSVSRIVSGKVWALCDERYWLCCGSRNPAHNDRTCLEARAGYPDRMRFGTPDEHSAWSRGGRA